MNFLNAIKHAAIGYGIRRKEWHPAMILHLGNLGSLHWIHIEQDAVLLGPSPLDLGETDIRSEDWETV